MKPLEMLEHYKNKGERVDEVLFAAISKELHHLRTIIDQKNFSIDLIGDQKYVAYQKIGMQDKEIEGLRKELATTQTKLEGFKAATFAHKTAGKRMIKVAEQWQADNKRLREALEKYAAKENYERVANESDVLENGMIAPTWEPSWIELDNGEIAREALESEGGKE